MYWMHKFQDKFFILNLLSSALQTLVNVSYFLKVHVVKYVGVGHL